MGKKLLIIYVLGAILIALSLTSYSDVNRHQKTITIRFASEIYPPFTLLNTNKELHGFDIELAQALCKKINANCTFN